MTTQAPEVLLTYLRQGFPVADVAPVVLPPESSLKEAWRPTPPHGREGFILAPCKA